MRASWLCLIAALACSPASPVWPVDVDAQAAALSPDGGAVIAKLTCTSACPDSTMVIYTVAGQHTYRFIALPRRADTVAFSRGPSAFAVQVEFVPLKVTKSVTLTIAAAPAAPPPPIVQPTLPTASLSAAPLSIAPGQSSTVTWSCTNATSAQANGATVPLSGSQSYAFPTTTTLTLTCSNVNGSASQGVTVTVASAPPPVSSGALFSDSFERASIGYAQNGVSYDAANVDISSAVSRTGTRSARFMAGLTKDRDWSELRFNGLANLPDVFLQYYVWQPAGFPIPQPGNNKFFRLWSGDYDASKIRVGASTWGGRIGIEYDKNFSPQNAPGGTTPMGLTGENYDGTTEPINYAPFLGVASYQNRWVRVRIHAKVASAANNDGVVQIWLDDALVLNRVKMPIYAVNGIGNYFTAGYLFGWANGKWPSGYVLYVDDFTISATGFAN